MNTSHFKDKDAISHVVEKQAEGIISAQEVHGTEAPGHISAATDSIKETAVVLSFAWLIAREIQLPFSQIIVILLIFSFSWLVWKSSRSAWLGWSRLERLHRVVAEEKWEIDHHRTQEREELKALYRAKGFEGKLLDDVIDVLMADGDRLLKVMVEEELGLSLSSQQHPLKQATGALIGTFLSAMICIGGIILHQEVGLVIAALLSMGAAAALSAHYEKNNLIPAIVWNIGLGILSIGTFYFLMKYFSEFQFLF